MNEDGLSLRQRIKNLTDKVELTVMAYHQLDKRLEVVGKDKSLAGAKLVADCGMIEDEQYNDIEELKGSGIGFSYFVVNPAGKILYRNKKADVLN